MSAPIPTGAVSCSTPAECLCKGRRYTCPRCLRFVPWCFGASGGHPELCDDCWAHVEGAADAA